MKYILVNIVQPPFFLKELGVDFDYLEGGGILKIRRLEYGAGTGLFFFTTIILGKKVIQSCLKMNLKISHQLR